MKGIPPEIDALMWRLAEEGGPLAQEEFEQRHTRYAPELSRRIRMVSELRAAGKTTSHRPTFAPRPTRVAATPRWAIGTAAGLAVLAFGAVAYVVASGGERPQVAPNPVPVKVAIVPEINTAPAPLPQTPIVRKQPEIEVPPEPPKPVAKPKYLEPREVHLADTNLTDGIQMIAQGGGLKATIAPGFVEEKVTLDYEGLNTLQMLETMGSQYGFTVMDEGDGEILVVPVRDKAESTRRVGP